MRCEAIAMAFLLDSLRLVKFGLLVWSMEYGVLSHWILYEHPVFLYDRGVGYLGTLVPWYLRIAGCTGDSLKEISEITPFQHLHYKQTRLITNLRSAVGPTRKLVKRARAARWLLRIDQTCTCSVHDRNHNRGEWMHMVWIKRKAFPPSLPRVQLSALQRMQRPRSQWNRDIQRNLDVVIADPGSWVVVCKP